MADMKTKIIPGILHWDHPNFFAYFPNGNSYPSILAELMMAGLNAIGFSWVSINMIYNTSAIIFFTQINFVLIIT